MGYNKDYHREYYLRNKEKKKEASRAWKKANPDKAKGYRKNERDLRLRRVYGITLEEYEAMYEIQNGLCAICNKEETNKLLAVDHCHGTGKVRGLLCAKCNQGIGHFNDDSNLLERAIKYVQGNNSN